MHVCIYICVCACMYGLHSYSVPPSAHFCFFFFFPSFLFLFWNKFSLSHCVTQVGLGFAVLLLKSPKALGLQVYATPGLFYLYFMLIFYLLYLWFFFLWKFASLPLSLVCVCSTLWEYKSLPLQIPQRDFVSVFDYALSIGLLWSE